VSVRAGVEGAAATPRQMAALTEALPALDPAGRREHWGAF
jgi:hypothetical protein